MKRGQAEGMISHLLAIVFAPGLTLTGGWRCRRWHGQHWRQSRQRLWLGGGGRGSGVGSGAGSSGVVGGGASSGGDNGGVRRPMGGGPMWPRDGTWGMPLAGRLAGAADCKEPAVEWVTDKACMEAVETLSTFKRYTQCGCCRYHVSLVDVRCVLDHENTV